MTLSMLRNLRAASFPILLATIGCLVPGTSRAGGWFHHSHEQNLSQRTRGAWLDPGLPPGQPGYFGIGPGHQAGACPRPGCLGGFGSTTKMLNGLHHRYPWFCGYIPAPPRRECLYQTGAMPWQRD